MVAMAAQNPPAQMEKLGVPSRNPLPLSASQEAQVRDIYYQNVRKQCAEEIKGESSWKCMVSRGLRLRGDQPTQSNLSISQHVVNMTPFTYTLLPTQLLQPAPSAEHSLSPSPADPNTAP